jgi:hypothetical protein
MVLKRNTRTQRKFISLKRKAVKGVLVRSNDLGKPFRQGEYQ